jgi:hypothetical protein
MCLFHWKSLLPINKVHPCQLEENPSGQQEGHSFWSTWPGGTPPGLNTVQSWGWESLKALREGKYHQEVPGAVFGTYFLKKMNRYSSTNKQSLWGPLKEELEPKVLFWTLG